MYNILYIILTNNLINFSVDFKNMKIMGNALKQCGAFFLHRGEKSQNIINRSVLNEYVKYLITYESSPLQFFIEGTRSRSNKSIIPKLGDYYCLFEYFYF